MLNRFIHTERPPITDSDRMFNYRRQLIETRRNAALAVVGLLILAISSLYLLKK